VYSTVYCTAVEISKLIQVIVPVAYSSFNAESGTWMVIGQCSLHGPGMVRALFERKIDFDSVELFAATKHAKFRFTKMC